MVCVNVRYTREMAGETQEERTTNKAHWGGGGVEERREGYWGQWWPLSALTPFWQLVKVFILKTFILCVYVLTCTCM